MPSRYAVIGHPIAHSRSPEIHTAFARELNHAMVYERLLAPLDQFIETVQAFRASGGAGCNITVPFKEAAYAFCNAPTARAILAGAVNTLRFDPNGVIVGDNTDGVGLVRDIQNNLGYPLKGKRILLLGAGGAARGVVGEIFSTQPARLAIHNRTQEKAEVVAALFAAIPGGPPVVLTAAQLAEQSFDIIINATSAGLKQQALTISESVFRPGVHAYDMVYGKEPTPFLRQALTAGATAADGLGMLVEQAAEAFFVWRGVRPETQSVIAALRNAKTYS